MRILVTGSRHWTDREAIEQALIDVTEEYVQLTHVLIHGDALGADTLSSQIVLDWVEQGVEWATERFPADWTKHGRKAGPIRNVQMLAEGKPDICLAFPLPGSKGTWDMIRKANKAGVEVRIIPPRRTEL